MRLNIYSIVLKMSMLYIEINCIYKKYTNTMGCSLSCFTTSKRLSLQYPITLGVLEPQPEVNIVPLAGRSNTHNPNMNATLTPHLLVVEDHPVFRRFLISWLSRTYRVTAVGSGLEALKWLQAGNQTDALLLDLDLPQISGWQVLRNLRFSGLFAELPVVAMTSNFDEEVRTRCEALGTSGVFAKPYNPHAVLDALACATGYYARMQAA